MTTRRLVLVRHAKAADGTVDIARPLAARGVRDAAAIGEWLLGHAVVPDLVVVSPARRAAQTWERAVVALPGGPDPVVDGRIYVNSVKALLEAIHATPPDVLTVVLVGHNPAVAELASILDDERGDTDARAELARGYPTSGVAMFAVHTPWRALAPTSATLTHFSAPRG